VLAFVVRFSDNEEKSARAEMDARVAVEMAAAEAMGD